MAGLTESENTAAEPAPAAEEGSGLKGGQTYGKSLNAKSWNNEEVAEEAKREIERE